MKIFTILGAGWLGFELAKKFKNDYKVKVSSRSEEKIKMYEDEGLFAYILNENNLEFLDQLLDTDYLFINFPPSKFEDYLTFLNKIYSHQKIKNIEKIFFISSTSAYPNNEGFFDEEYEIKSSSSKIVFDAETLVSNKTDIIFRVSALVGANRVSGRRLSAKFVEYPKSVINFVHRNDVIDATKFAIENNLNGIFNLCSKEHPTKEELYSFNAKKYDFPAPIFSKNEKFLNRIIDGTKIEKEGFIYKHNNAFELV
jgi:nucleoside-diphosphate-sugar epimerase